MFVCVLFSKVSLWTKERRVSIQSTNTAPSLKSQQDWEKQQEVSEVGGGGDTSAPNCLWVKTREGEEIMQRPHLPPSHL